MSDPAGKALAFKHRDATSYDEVTDDFDRFTERFTGAIAARLVELAALSPGESVLDVGCGTGVVTFKAAERVGTRGTVVGIDLSDGMLAKAAAKSARAPSPLSVSFLKMDAEALDFPDGKFDCVLSLFALRHFPHPDAALAQMRRVLKPGGRAVVAVGSGPELLSAAGLAAAWRRIGAMLGLAGGRGDLIACGYLDALVERHLPAGAGDEEAQWTKEHHASGSVSRMMAGAGFDDVRTTWAGNDGVVETKEEFWDVQATFSSLARKRLAGAPAEALERIRREFDAGCDRARASGARLRYPMGALIVTGKAGGRP